MEDKFVLIEQDGEGQITDVKGPYTYKEALTILEDGHKSLGGKLHVPDGNHGWAFEWHYEDYNGTHWSINPTEREFEYPEDLD